MSGLVMLTNPPDRQHLRLIFELVAPQKRLLFWDQRGLGVVRLVSPAEFETYYGPEKIGPDALQITVTALRQQLGSSRRSIKVALLDQRVVAGIGNIYASEILHRVGINPRESCNRIRPRQWSQLHAEMVAVLREAIQHEGSTLRDFTYRVSDGERGKYQFQVYQRAGKSCPHCRQAQILRIVQAQRCTFFCPACQPLAATERNPRSASPRPLRHTGPGVRAAEP